MSSDRARADDIQVRADHAQSDSHVCSSRQNPVDLLVTPARLNLSGSARRSRAKERTYVSGPRLRPAVARAGSALR